MAKYCSASSSARNCRSDLRMEVWESCTRADDRQTHHQQTRRNNNLQKDVGRPPHGPAVSDRRTQPELRMPRVTCHGGFTRMSRNSRTSSSVNISFRRKS